MSFAWYILLAAALVLFACVLWQSEPSRAVELTLHGYASGHGNHSLVFAGDNISAHIWQGNSSEAWHIMAGGRA